MCVCVCVCVCVFVSRSGIGTDKGSAALTQTNSITVAEPRSFAVAASGFLVGGGGSSLGLENFDVNATLASRNDLDEMDSASFFPLPSLCFLRSQVTHTAAMKGRRESTK